MPVFEDVKELIELGRFEEALEKIPELSDRLERVEAIVELILAILKRGEPLEWIPTLLEDAEYLAESIEEPADKAMAYSMVGYAYRAAGYVEESETCFANALDELEEIEDPLQRGAAIGTTAYYMALAGDSKSALQMFDVAFEVITRATVDYSKKVEGLIALAGLMEDAGDALHSKKALPFYRTAFDIFDKLHVNQRAGGVEKKIELAETLYETGRPEIRRALLEGRYRHALALIEKLYTGEKRLIGKLEVALWMKRVNNPAYKELVREVLGEGNLELSQVGVQRVAGLLTHLGRLEDALSFALRIESPERKSGALRGIALALAGEKRFKDAEKVANAIPTPEIRAETLRDLKTLHGSG
ncbi:hypothetical protein [Thermococcus sp.]|uniref:hypothetical protein n=1 Tax=Thermococcus sp. TaxID=35749 RepID=UPI0026227EF3|nr:hypothetical protein [Thermococcus sp.]